MVRITTNFLPSVWKTLILFGVIFLNSWIWKIARDNLLIAIILITLTILLFQFLSVEVFKTIVLIMITVLLLVISYMMLKADFDKSLQTFTPEDNVKLNDRHFYYSQELGKVFLNNKVLNYYKNYSLKVYKLERNIFSNLDLNLYFFASAPRERPGISEFEKYSPIFLPFFILGVLLAIYQGSIWVTGYLTIALIVTAFTAYSYKLGPILFFPLINVCISTGIIRIFSLMLNSRDEN